MNFYYHQANFFLLNYEIFYQKDHPTKKSH